MGSSTVELALDKLAKGIMLDEPDRQVLREWRLIEPGDQPPCPFCQKPRVMRSDYVRCNPCGVNWLMSEMHLPNYLNRNPSAARSEAARMANTVQPTAEPKVGNAEV